MLKTLLLSALATSMLVAPSFAQSPAPTLNVCTGGTTGKYYLTAAELGAQVKGQIALTPIETNGSLDNFDRLATGQCDAAIVQADAYGSYVTRNPTARLNVKRVVPLYNEYVHMVCNRDAGISNINDIKTKNATVLVGPNGSGTSLTWETWVKQDESFAKVPTKPEGGMNALTTIRDGVDAECALFVSGLQSGTMMEYNELGGKALQLVTIDAAYFDDIMDPKGQRVYEFSEIPGNTYPNMQNLGMFGMQTGIKTLALGAVLIINQSWVDANPKGFENFSKAALRWVNQQP